MKVTVTRRDLLKVGGGMVAGSVAGQALLDPLTAPLAGMMHDAVYGEPVDTIEPTSTDQTAARLPYMADNAIADARDIAAETGGLNRLWWQRADRAGVLKYATRVRRRDDGRLIIVSHGEGLVLWDRRAPATMPGRPLDEQPDRKFGRFADRCMWEALQHQRQALHARRAETITKGHVRPRIIEYYAWTAADGDEAVSVALTLEQVAQGRSPGRSPRDTGAVDRTLLSHDATTPHPPYRLARRPRRSVAL